MECFRGEAFDPVLVAALNDRAAEATSLPVMEGSVSSHLACRQGAVGESPSLVQISFHCFKPAATINEEEAVRDSPSPTVEKSLMGSSSRFVSRRAAPTPVASCFSAYLAQGLALAAACASFCL